MINTVKQREIELDNISLLDRITSWVMSNTSHQLLEKNSKDYNENEHIHVDLDEFSIEKWTDQRVKILEILWGRGNRLPGDDELNKKLFVPYTLNSKSKILDIAVGLGACARMIAQDNYAHVDVVESYPELLPYLIKFIREKKLTPFISVLHNNLTEVELPRAKYDLIYGREAFFKIKDKRHVIGKCINALANKGQLVFTDFVLEKDACTNKIFTNWSERERQNVYPVSQDVYQKIFNRFDLKLNPVTDHSKEYISYMNSGWARLKKHLETHEFDDEFVNVMAQESDLWLSRVRALRSGKLKLVKFHVRS